MDWKQILDVADEDYLVGISNKGIVKRAYKDKDELGEVPAIDFFREGLELTVGEETVKIVHPLGESKCSCPSRSICRHVILGILLAKEQAEGILEEAKEEKGPEESVTSPNLDGLSQEIFDYPLKKLLRVLGNKGLSRLTENMEQEHFPQIQKTSVITVQLPNTETVVKLLSPLEYSSCTCHKKELCSHKAEAVLWCQFLEKKISLEELNKQETEWDKESLRETLSQIKGYLEELLYVGLCRSSKDVIHTLERLAIMAHNENLPRFENRLRSLAEVYGKYLKRSAGFSVSDAQRRLLGLYGEVLKLSRTDNNSEINRLAGEFHAEYKPVGSLDLVGVTWEHFASRSGYEGDTIYFLEKHTGEWYTYTNARPLFYDNSKRNKYAGYSAAPWGLSVSLEDMVSVEIHLENAKADGNGRLSSSQETRGEVVGRRNLSEELLKPWYYRDFAVAFEERIQVGDEGGLDNGIKPQNPVFLQPAGNEKAVFDEVEQVLFLRLFDEQAREAIVELPYSEREKENIRYLERVRANQPPCFVGRLYLKDDTLRMYPLDMFREKDLPWSDMTTSVSGAVSGDRQEWNPEEAEASSEAGSEASSETSSEAGSEAVFADVLEDMGDLLKEVEQQLGDLYQIGFDTVQDTLCSHLKALGERAGLYGMRNLAEELESFAKHLSMERHQLRRSENAGDMILQYQRIYEYVSMAQKKVLYDKAKQHYR